MSLSIKKIEDRKAEICETILRSLPDWFGLEQAIIDYVTEVEKLPFVLAQVDGKDVGFLSLKQHYPKSFEIYVMGVLSKYHAKGIGKQLVLFAENLVKEKNGRYLSVKTLSTRHPDPFYAKTREFYLRCRFEPFEEFTDLWDESNPCLQMIKYVGENNA